MAFKKAFTIVELLVVIIVIAVLVSLALVGYSGISSKANIATLQSDLANAKKQLLSFQASSSTNSFPTAINCYNPSSTEICIRPTGSNSFIYKVNNSSTVPAFTLSATNGIDSYRVSNLSGVELKPNIVTANLVFNLDASDATSYPRSGSTWYDTTGNVPPTTISGTVASTSRSVIFDGSTTKAFANWPTALNITDSTTDRTWEMVVKLANSTSYFPLFGHKSGISCGYYCNGGFNSNYGQIIFVSYDGTNYIRQQSGVYFDAVNFYHLVASYSGLDQKPRLYVNGQLKVTGAATTISYSGGMIYYDFGYDSKYNSNYLNGEIGIMRFYKGKALTDAEVLQNYNAIKDTYGL